MLNEHRFGPFAFARTRSALWFSLYTRSNIWDFVVRLSSTPRP